jgi:hypothetical protein
MLTQRYSGFHVALAVGVILLAFWFRSRGKRERFRWLLLAGVAGLIPSSIAAGFVNEWMVVGLGVLWFVIAGYFIVQERQERLQRPK